MRKSILLSIFIWALSMGWNTNCVFAQEITVPDYSYGMVYSEQGRVSSIGVANPGPSGGYSMGEDARASGVSFANGYRWWIYPSMYGGMFCGDLPKFNFPGLHSLWITSGTTACINPPFGYMGSWGGVIVDPAKRDIWSLHGAHHTYGPTQPYCIKNPYGSGQICWPVPDEWGSGLSYGYLRKAVVIQSGGSLKIGDPVNIKATIKSQGVHEGDGTVTSNGVLFMNKISRAQWATTKDYLNWSDVEDILGTPSMANSMLALLQVGMNNTDDSTATVAIGDTIILELMFNNSIELVNPYGPGDAEGWIGKKPPYLYSDYSYAKTDTIRKLIKRLGNRLTYDLICLTQGAVLEPVTADGPNVDEDKDGISDAQEKGVNGNNSNFDGNSDGTPDYKQPNVASFQTYNGDNYVTLAVPAGTELSQLIATDNPSPLDAPADADFPFGFFDFSIDGLDPGEAITVSLILHDAGSVGKYYKYGMTPDSLKSHWYEFMFNGQTGAQINGNVITLHFVDGLRGDEDITVNGSIKEPGGPAIAGTTGMTELTEKRGIMIYPNPVTDILTLRLNNIIQANDYIINIYSITGALVHQKVIEVLDSGQELFVPVDHLPEGIYVITLSGNTFSFNRRFIKLK